MNVAETNAKLGGLPPKTAVYLLVGTGALVLFLLLGVLPMQKSLDDQDLAIRQARFQIEEQHALQPIFLKMLAIAQAGGAKAKPVPKVVVLNQEEISRVTDTLTALVVGGGLEAVAVTPDPSSLDRGSKALSVALHVRGDLERFRALLDALSELPFFENVESVQIRPQGASRDFQAKIWLAAQ